MSKYLPDGYIMVTPCKNEEESLNKLIKSVIMQTIKPKLWLIVDDSSTDNSPKIISDACKKYEFIRSFRLESKDKRRDINFKYAHVCRQGFEGARKYAKSTGIIYNYIALLDADIILEKKYFEKLIQQMNRDKKLGVASGGIYYDTPKGLIYEKMYKDRPMGAARLWRKEAFEESGGFLQTCMPDAVSNIKIQNRGWNIRQFPQIKAVQTRETSSAEGLWKGYKAKGEAGHYVGTSPSLALMKSAKFLFKPPFYISAAYLYGYMKSLIKRNNRIDDSEIIEYYSNKRFKELLRKIFRIKNDIVKKKMATNKKNKRE